MANGTKIIRLLQNMPAEVLNHIFYYLPAEDRRSVRLTCHYFNEACDTLDIQKTEEFAFYGSANVTCPILSLCDIRRKVWNIRLNGEKLDKSIVPFFNKQGPYIQSLTFYNCHRTNGERVLPAIMECCPKLRSFAFIYALPDLHHKGELDWFSNTFEYNIFTDLAALHERNITFASLTCFTLILLTESRAQKSWVITNNQFLHIFDVFPNIKELDVRVDVDKNFQRFSAVDPPERTFSFSCIRDQLMKMSHQLESLSLQFVYPNSQSVFRGVDSYVSSRNWKKIADIEMPKLKKLSLALSGHDFDEAYIDSFSAFKNLTNLNCTVESKIPFYGITVILNTATKLNYLTITVEDLFVSIDEECFEALVKSKLIVLNANTVHDNTSTIDGFVNFDHSSLDNSLLPNYTLKQLNMAMTNNDSVTLFLKYFRRLENFSVPKPVESIPNILDHRKQLKSLQLVDLNHRYLRSTNNSAKSEVQDLSSCYQFDSLIYLDILDDYFTRLSSFLVNGCSFPRLKSLHIQRSCHSRGSDFFQLLCQMIQKLSQLEYLTVTWHLPIDFRQVSTLIETLPQLRYLHLHDPRFENSYKYDVMEDSFSKCCQLFDLNPSLRSFIIHFGGDKIKCNRYVKDIVKNEIIFSELHDWTEIVEGIPFYYYDFAPHYVLVPTYIEYRRMREYVSTFKK